MNKARLALGWPLFLAAATASAADPGTDNPTKAANAETGSADRELARQLFAAGVSLARSGHYEAAKSLFLQAYAAAPHYLVLYNIAQAELQLGQFAAAVNDLRRFLLEGGTAIDEQQRARVEAEIARAEHDAAQTQPPPADATPPPPPAARGADVEGEPPLPPGASAATATEQQSPAPAKPIQPGEQNAVPSGAPPPIWAYGLVTAGVVALAGGAALYVWNDARYEHWRLENDELRALKEDALQKGVAPASDPALLARAQRNDQRLHAVQQFDLVPLVAGGVGLAALGIGLWKIIDRKDSTWQVSVALYPADISARLVW